MFARPFLLVFLSLVVCSAAHADNARRLPVGVYGKSAFGNCVYASKKKHGKHQKAALPVAVWNKSKWGKAVWQ